MYGIPFQFTLDIAVEQKTPLRQDFVWKAAVYDLAVS
jgi:hypothetical protein